MRVKHALCAVAGATAVVVAIAGVASAGPAPAASPPSPPIPAGWTMLADSTGVISMPVAPNWSVHETVHTFDDGTPAPRVFAGEVPYDQWIDTFDSEGALATSIDYADDTDVTVMSLGPPDDACRSSSAPSPFGDADRDWWGSARFWVGCGGGDTNIELFVFNIGGVTHSSYALMAQFTERLDPVVWEQMVDALVVDLAAYNATPAVEPAVTTSPALTAPVPSATAPLPAGWTLLTDATGLISVPVAPEWTSTELTGMSDGGVAYPRLYAGDAGYDVWSTSFDAEGVEAAAIPFADDPYAVLDTIEPVGGECLSSNSGTPFGDAGRGFSGAVRFWVGCGGGDATLQVLVFNVDGVTDVSFVVAVQFRERLDTGLWEQFVDAIVVTTTA